MPKTFRKSHNKGNKGPGSSTGAGAGAGAKKKSAKAKSPGQVPKHSNDASRPNKTTPGAHSQRSAATVRRLNMYKERPKRDKKGKMLYQVRQTRFFVPLGLMAMMLTRLTRTIHFPPAVLPIEGSPEQPHPA